MHVKSFSCLDQSYTRFPPGVFHAFYFQEEKLLYESVKKIAENLTQLRKEINKTQQDMINNVRSVCQIFQTLIKKKIPMRV